MCSVLTLLAAVVYAPVAVVPLVGGGLIFPVQVAPGSASTRERAGAPGLGRLTHDVWWALVSGGR